MEIGSQTTGCGWDRYRGTSEDESKRSEDLPAVSHSKTEVLRHIVLGHPGLHQTLHRHSNPLVHVLSQFSGLRLSCTWPETVMCSAPLLYTRRQTTGVHAWFCLTCPLLIACWWFPDLGLPMRVDCTALIRHV